jgi:hypothetical protein
MAVPTRGGDGGARLPASGRVAAGAAPRRQSARAQQGGRRPGLVEGPHARQGILLTRFTPYTTPCAKNHRSMGLIPPLLPTPYTTN